MRNLQGLLACSGKGSRFARSVGKEPPYPKHLEMIGDNSILGSALDGLVKYVPVSGITFTLNPTFKDLYVPHLTALQERYPTLPLSYAVSSYDSEGESLYADIRRTIGSGVFNLGDERIDFGDPIAVFAYGDAIIEIEQGSEVQQKIENYRPKLEMGWNMGVLNYDVTIYHLARLNYLSGHYPHEIVEAGRYGLKRWNINTLRQLQEAREEILGQPLVEDEHHRSLGKERI